MRGSFYRCAGIVLAALTGTLVSGCTQATLGRVLGPSWKEAALPDGKLTPGAVVYMAPAGGNTVDLKWLGTLADCNVPSSALTIVSGDVPGMTGNFSVGGSLKADLLHAFHVSADASHKATLAINQASDQSLNYLAFTNWFGAHATSFPQQCAALLSKHGVYVVQEAFVVSNGNFSSADKGGIQVQILAPKAAQVATSANSALSAVASGKITPAAALAAAAAPSNPPAAGTGTTTGSGGTTAATTGAPGATARTSGGNGGTPGNQSSIQQPLCTPVEDSSAAAEIAVSANRAFCITVSRPITFAVKGMQDVAGSWTGAMYSLSAPPAQDPLSGKVIRSVEQVTVPATP